MDRFQRLILSFYREDPLPLEGQEAIKACEISREWDLIIIKCFSLENLYEVDKVITHIKFPLAEIGIGNKIALELDGSIIKMYQIKMSSPTDLFA